MCEPTTLLVGALVAGTAYQAVTASAAAKSQASQQIYQGQANQAVAEFNAEATENAAEFSAQQNEENALIYEQAAVDSVQRGADAAAAERQTGRNIIASSDARTGSSGTTIGTGTNLAIAVENAGISEGNALTILNNSEREGRQHIQSASQERRGGAVTQYNAQLEASSLRAGGEVGLLASQYGAANTQYGGRLNVGSTLVSGATNIASFGLRNYHQPRAGT